MQGQTKIENIFTLFSAVCEARDWFARPIWWRGQASLSWKLVPHLYRSQVSRVAEQSICREFMSKARTRHSICPEEGNKAAWLFLMQHYRLPTRLLDWSESPLIAAYFAVTQKDGEPGSLYALSPEFLNKNQAQMCAILTADHYETRPLIESVFDTNLPSTSKVLAIGASQIDIRMLVQLAHFTIHDSLKSIEELDMNPDSFLIRFEIPAKAKPIIRDQLMLVGMHEANVFPDLEHLATDLSECYRIA